MSAHLGASPRRARRVIGTVACLATAAVFSQPALAGEPTTPPHSAHTLAAPPPVPPVVSVVPMGLVEQNEHVQCRDATYSALIGGKSVWAFGDTCLDDGGELGDQFIDNSLAASTSLDASDGITLNRDLEDSQGVPVRVIPLTENEIAFNETHAPNEIAVWSGHIIDDPERRRALLFYVSVYRGSQIGFSSVGGGIAVANRTFTSVTRPDQSLDPDAPEPSYMWGADEQSYAGGYLRVGDMLYLYGGSPQWLYTQVHVARVPIADVLDKTKWRYWDGTRWSTENADLATVYRGGAAGDTLFWDEYLGMYVTVYQPYLDNNVYYRVANRPEGPWSAQTLLFTAEEGTNPSYAARVHTEFAEGNGRTHYVTYVKNTGFLRQELPLVKVTFGKP